MAAPDLAGRSRRLLAALVGVYVETGEPVSSSVLTRKSGLGVSSATIRNALAQLEREGYVHQPHTSAGRVPTDRGYRAFVDMLLESRKPVRSPVTMEKQLRRRAGSTPLVDDVLADVSHVVSRAARHVGFAMAENPGAVLQRIEFVALGDFRVLVIVVSKSNHVTQKVVDAGERVQPHDLVQATNYLNTEFSGLPLLEVRRAVLARLEQERTLYDQLLLRALRLARSTLEDLPNHQTFHLDGVASLLDDLTPPGAVSLSTLRALLEMIEEKGRMLHLLNQYIDGPGLTVVIGTEHSAPNLRSFSLVASTALDGATLRTVGVIGPTRMHYSRAITLVDGTAQAMSRVLRDA
jgi:heat-inducible transcriptional repressor